MEVVKGFIVAIVLWAVLIADGFAQVTMDVDKWSGSSGTYLCKDVLTCRNLWVNAEMRGDTYYCNSVIIKRDGRIVWFKNYYR